MRIRPRTASLASAAGAADAATRRAWDGVMALWVVFWLVAGAWAAFEIWQLTALASSTVESGRALGAAGQALRDLAGAPLIGARAGALGDQVLATATNIVSSGEQAGRSIRGLGVLVGLAVGLGPAGPVLMVYLPARLARHRENRAISRALRDPARAPAAMAHLAARAVCNLRFAELMAITADPGAALAQGRYDELALAEIRRLGLAEPVHLRR